MGHRGPAAAYWSLKRSRFGVPGLRSLFRPEMRLLVAADLSADWTLAGDAEGGPWRYRAAPPAVCGEAMLVPLMVFVAVSLPPHAEVMSCPGANQSVHLPQFENEAFRSDDVLAAVVIASPTRAGEKPH